MGLFGGGGDANLLITVGANITGADAQMSKLGREVDNLAKKLQQGSTSGSGFAAGISKMAVPIGAAVVGVTALVGIMGKAVQMAAEEEVGITRMNTALQNNVAGWDGNTAAVERAITATERWSGFSDGDLRDSMSSLITRTKDVAEAQNLQAIAMDLARAKGISLATATDLVGKVHDGNIGILSRYGIAVEKGASATQALASIQEQTKGQAEAYGNTTAGAMDKLQNAMDNAMETIGGAVLPILADFATKAADLIPKIVEIATKITDFLKPAFELIGGILNGIGTVLGTIGGALGLFGDDTEEAANKAAGAADTMATGMVGSFGLVGPAADDMADDTSTALLKLDPAYDKADKDTKAAIDNIIKYFEDAPPRVSTAVDGLVDATKKAEQLAATGKDNATAHVTALCNEIDGLAPFVKQRADALRDPFEANIQPMGTIGMQTAQSLVGSTVATIDANAPAVSAAANNLVKAADKREFAATLGAIMGKSLSDSMVASMVSGFKRVQEAAGVLALSGAPGAGMLKGIADNMMQGLGEAALIKRVAGGGDSASGIEGVRGANRDNRTNTMLGIEEVPQSVIDKNLESLKPKTGGGGSGGGKGGGGGKSAAEVAADAAKEQQSKVENAIKSAQDMIGKIDALAKVANFTLPPTFEQGAAAFAAAVRSVTDKLAEVSSHFADETLAHLSVFADSAGKGMDLVSKGVDALMKLGDFKKPADEAVTAFTDALAYTIGKLGDIAAKWSIESLAILAFFSESTGKAMEMVGKAVDSLSKLNDFKKPADDAMTGFVDALDFVTDKLRRVIAKWSTEALEQAATFGENTGKFVEGVGKAVDTLKALGDFKKPADDAVSGFVDSLDYLIALLNSRISNWWGHVNETTATIAKAAGDMASGVLGAVEPLLRLGSDEFKGPTQAAVDAFFDGLDKVVDALNARIPLWWGRMTETSAMIGKAVGDTVGGVLGAVDGLSKLTDFKRPPAEAIDAFFAALGDFLREFDKRAADFSAQASVLAAELATRIGTVGENIGKAFDPILKMADVQKVDRGAIEGAMANLHFALYQLDIVIKGLPADFAAKAQEFANSVGSIFGNIGAAMGVVTSMENPEGLAGAISTTIDKAKDMVAYFNVDVAGALTTLATNAGIARDGWNSAMESMALAVEDFARRAITALQSIPGTAGGSSTPAGQSPTFTLPGFADGGAVAGGKPIIVGERGPELFVPGASGVIVPNGGGGVGVAGQPVVVQLYVDGQRVTPEQLSQRTGLRVSLSTPRTVLAGARG
jgi:hypothetical protein